MPHVIVKLWPGKSKGQIAELTNRIVNDVCEVLGYGEESDSVAFEEVSSSDWKGQVYEPDIEGQARNLTKKPGYKM